jgi:hypothetical protein
MVTLRMGGRDCSVGVEGDFDLGWKVSGIQDLAELQTEEFQGYYGPAVAVVGSS